MLHLLRSTGRLVYGIYAMTAFVIVVLILFCPLLIVAPRLPLRRAIGRFCVRAWLAVSFIPFSIRGLERLPPGPCIVACNHASYVDGIILTAALPARFTFLVQHGAADWPYVGLVVRRMGVVFVNRESARAAATVMRALIERLRAGAAIAIFPEGTFAAAPALQAFQPGAFLMAARAGAPIVPVVMRGTRRLFGEGQRLPRPSRVAVECFAPILPQAGEREDAVRLQDAVRAVILQHCGETDGAPATAPSPSL